MIFDKSFPMSHTDKRCVAALAALWVAVGLVGDVLEGGGDPGPPPVDKPQVEVTWEAPLEQPQLLEAMVVQLEQDLYREDIPLNRELQAVLRESCEVNGVALCDALGLIEVESGFQVDAVSREGCFGLFQLNPKYYPSDLTPAENIQAGVAHLASQIKRYDGDILAALTAYNAGYDTGSRSYARKVMEASEKWGCG